MEDCSCFEDAMVDETLDIFYGLNGLVMTYGIIVFYRVR